MKSTALTTRMGRRKGVRRRGRGRKEKKVGAKQKSRRGRRRWKMRRRWWPGGSGERCVLKREVGKEEGKEGGWEKRNEGRREEVQRQVHEYTPAFQGISLSRFSGYLSFPPLKFPLPPSDRPLPPSQAKNQLKSLGWTLLVASLYGGANVVVFHPWQFFQRSLPDTIGEPEGGREGGKDTYNHPFIS